MGVVTSNQDKENLGRVMVKFPWLGDESHWARVATLMAGKDRGTFFMPEVGDEVVVAFDHGDINYPYVIGALWNGTGLPPEANSDGKNYIKMFRSKGGHEIIFDDNLEDKKGKIELKTRSGLSLILDDTDGKEKIEIKGNKGENEKNFIQLDSAQNSITISGAGKLTIKANAIDIESGGPINIKSTADMTLKGSLIRIN